VTIALAPGRAGPTALVGAPRLTPSQGVLLAPPSTGDERTGRARRADVTHAQIIELYGEHHDSLVRFASLVAPENGMAEDLVQEAFVRLYGSWRNIRDRDKVPAYLRSTIANLARGRGRRLGVASRHRPTPAPDAASAEEGVLQLENRSEVVAMLRRLPARQRECLVLRYYEGQTESEIAATLGISVGSVRTHTTRAMAALQRHYGVPS
jgi:RNA polymerase sigma-70 factor (sigma-E family)